MTVPYDVLRQRASLSIEQARRLGEAQAQAEAYAAQAQAQAQAEAARQKVLYEEAVKSMFRQPRQSSGSSGGGLGALGGNPLIGRQAAPSAPVGPTPTVFVPGLGLVPAPGLAGMQQQPADHRAQIEALRLMDAAVAESGEAREDLAGTPAQIYLAQRKAQQRRQELMSQLANAENPEAVYAQINNLDQAYGYLSQDLARHGLVPYEQLDADKRQAFDRLGDTVDRGWLTSMFKGAGTAAVQGAAGIAEAVTTLGEGIFNKLTGSSFTGITDTIDAVANAATEAIGDTQTYAQQQLSHQAQQIANDPKLGYAEKAAKLGALVGANPFDAASIAAQSMAGVALPGGLAVRAASKLVPGRVVSRARDVLTRAAPEGTRRAAAAEAVGGRFNLATATGAAGATEQQAISQINQTEGLTPEQRASAQLGATGYSAALGIGTALTPGLLPTIEAPGQAAFRSFGGPIRNVAGNALVAAKPIPGEAVQEFAQGAAESLVAPAAIAGATGTQLTPEQWNQAVSQGLVEAAFAAPLAGGVGAVNAARGGVQAASQPRPAVPQPGDANFIGPVRPPQQGEAGFVGPLPLYGPPAPPVTEGAAAQTTPPVSPTGVPYPGDLQASLAASVPGAPAQVNPLVQGGFRPLPPSAEAALASQPAPPVSPTGVPFPAELQSPATPTLPVGVPSVPTQVSPQPLAASVPEAAMPTDVLQGRPSAPIGEPSVQGSPGFVGPLQPPGLPGPVEVSPPNPLAQLTGEQVNAPPPQPEATPPTLPEGVPGVPAQLSPQPLPQPVNPLAQQVSAASPGSEAAAPADVLQGQPSAPIGEPSVQGSPDFVGPLQPPGLPSPPPPPTADLSTVAQAPNQRAVDRLRAQGTVTRQGSSTELNPLASKPTEVKYVTKKRAENFARDVTRDYEPGDIQDSVDLEDFASKYGGVEKLPQYVRKLGLHENKAISGLMTSLVDESNPNMQALLWDRLLTAIKEGQQFRNSLEGGGGKKPKAPRAKKGKGRKYKVRKKKSKQ